MDCIGDFKLQAKYKSNHIESLTYVKHDKVFKKDTIIYRNGVGFFLSDSVFNLKQNQSDFVRVSAVILDTTRTFVFQRKELSYQLMFIESALQDSCIGVRFIWKDNIRPVALTLPILDSLISFYKYEIPYEGQLLLNYYYDKGSLYYKVIEDHGSWKAGPEEYEQLTKCYGNIYFDIESIEKKRDWANFIKRLSGH